MKCNTVRKHLSAYMDNTSILGTETRSLVEEHLKGCDDCRSALSSMKALKDELATMEPVNAPDDFLASLNERLASRSRIGDFARRLFVPARIKIPVEFVAVAATALLVFVVVNTQQPGKQVPGTPRLGQPTEVAKRTTGSDHHGAMELAEYEPAATMPSDLEQIETGPPKKDRPAVSGRRVSVGPADKMVSDDFKPAVELAERVPEPKHEATFEEKTLPSPEEERTIELALLVLREKPKRGHGPKRLSQTVAYDQVREDAAEEERRQVSGFAYREDGTRGLMMREQAVRPSELRAKMASSADHAPESTPPAALPDQAQGRTIQEEETHTAHPAWSMDAEQDAVDGSISDLADALNEVEALVRLFKGKAVRMEYEEDPEALPSILARVPVEHYADLYKELRRLGNLQSPPPALPEKAQESVRIRIRILPAVSTQP